MNSQHQVSSRRRVQPQRILEIEPANVSVVIPCYNYARYLPDAVHSALNQPDVKVEVIIVDDASSDDSLDVAGLLATDQRVRVVTNGVNRGPVATFNRGLALAAGEFIVRLDADDMLTPGSLARAVALGQAFPSVGLVYGHPIHFRDEPPSARTEATKWTIWPGLQWLQRRCRRGTNVITAPEVMMRASVVREVGGQKDLDHSHDMEMWLRIAAHSDVGYIHGADQAWHRDHDLSLSAREVDLVSDLYDRRDAFEVLFSGIGSRQRSAVVMHRQAKRALGMEALTLASHQFDRRREELEVTRRLESFAAETWPNFGETRQGRALRRRHRLAPLLRKVPVFSLSALGRRIKYEYDYRTWSRNGL